MLVPVVRKAVDEGKYNIPRPRRCRRIQFDPEVIFFKPQGVPLKQLESVELSLEELEALRLKDEEQLDQVICAKKMNTSQSTFQRILASARKKVTEALIKGKAIRVNKE